MQLQLLEEDSSKGPHTDDCAGDPELPAHLAEVQRVARIDEDVETASHNGKEKTHADVAPRPWQLLHGFLSRFLHLRHLEGWMARMALLSTAAAVTSKSHS